MMENFRASFSMAHPKAKRSAHPTEHFEPEVQLERRMMGQNNVRFGSKKARSQRLPVEFFRFTPKARHPGRAGGMSGSVPLVD